MSITLFGIAAALGFIVSGFFLWKRARQENFPEDEVFDVYIVATLWAVAVARSVAIVLRFDRFGFDLLRWLSFFSLPGLNGLAALSVGVVMIWLAAIKRRWDPWLTGDVYLPALMLWQSILVAPFRWPVAVAWFLCFLLLLWIEREYRLWEWYRGRRSQARPGLVSSTWLIGVGIGLGLLAQPPLGVISLLTVGLSLVASGIVIGYKRSGRVWKSDVSSLAEGVARIGSKLTWRRSQRKMK